MCGFHVVFWEIACLFRTTRAMAIAQIIKMTFMNGIGALVGSLSVVYRKSAVFCSLNLSLIDSGLFHNLNLLCEYECTRMESSLSYENESMRHPAVTKCQCDTFMRH